MATTEILEERTEQGTQLCPLLANANEIDASSERSRLIIHHPCYERTITGLGENKKVKYERRPCDGYDITCPGHPQYRK